MNLRKETEKREELLLSPVAVKARKSQGRLYPEAECPIRTCFQRDRDRIIHSKSFRRLKHKTQVFIAPVGDHYRTRLTHTLEVSQIARTIGRALRLNEDLIEAIALGHDLGHTPFGHNGEEVLNTLHPNGFRHNEQSVRVVSLLERRKTDYPGLNLTKEVQEGILKHTGDSYSHSLEGVVIKYADRIAYINHDIDDAIRAGILTAEDLPREAIGILGTRHSDRINTMIVDIIKSSMGQEEITMSREILNATQSLRAFMFEAVYFNETVKSEDDKIEKLLTDLFKYYRADLNHLPADHLAIYEDIEAGEEDIICDYIAGMTDYYAISAWKDLFIPRSWNFN